jgi:outer membrane receptor protein involved in Fe transport
VSCASIQPEWSWNLRSTLTFGGATDVSVLWRHLSGNEVEPVAQGGPANVFPAYASIPAYDYIDLSIQQRITDVMRLTLTVTNLFDRDPPIVGNTIGATAFNSGNTYPSTYDPIGRRFNMGVNLRF